MSDPTCGIPGDFVNHPEVVYASSELPKLWDLAQMRLEEVWKMGITGKGVTCCIMDTGYASHPLIPAPKAKYNFTNSGGRNDVTDRHGHGSWCIGRVVGRRVLDGRGVGMAPDADLIVGKVLGDNGSGNTYWSEQCREWAAKEGADVLSVSIGGPRSSGNQLKDSMLRSNELGLLIECDAAGNAGYNGKNSIDDPGACEAGLCIGAYRMDGKISNFSSGGVEMDIAMPGEQVTSTSHRGSGWATMSGTSMAAPNASGLVALTIDKNRQMGIPDKEMTGAIYWRDLISKIAIAGGIEDAGQPGKDALHGYGKPLVLKWIDYLGDYLAI